jgi:PAS domain S-box-containing protein
MKTYAFAIAMTALAVLLRWLLDPVIRDALPLVTLFGAVAASVWYGGYRSAIVSALLGYLACSVLFIEPRGVLSLLDHVDQLVGFAAFLFTCALIIGIGQKMNVAQRRHHDEQERLRVTLRSIGDAVITTDTSGRVTDMNEVAESLTGWRLADARGLRLESVFRIVNETTGHTVESPATRVLREGVIVGLANHTVLMRRDGTQCPIDDSAAPIRDEHGRVAGCVLIFRDVTGQRLLERERGQQLLTARTLAAIVESSDDAIISKSLDGTIQSWNAGAERLFGHSAEEAIGKHISLVIPPDRIAEEDHIIARLKAGQRVDHFETERLRSNGERIQVSLTISPIRDGGGAVIGASKIARDITERRRVEADRQKFVTLVETSTDFIGLYDLEGIPFFVNRAGLELVGLTSMDEARRTPVREFFFPEDQARIMDEFFPKVLSDGHGELEVRFRHFRTGEARWMAYKVLTLADPNGHPSAYATVSQDVTERRRMEDHLHSLAADLSHADRRKDEFLATLAHELRNPLAPISNAVQILKRRDPANGADAEVTGLLERQVAHLSRLVDDLLDMSRISRGHIELRRERIELAVVVRQAIEATRAQYQKLGHELTITLPGQPVTLFADSTRLAQVIGNLLNNACKFTNRGGHVRLTVARHEHEVEIRVRDDGIGIPAAELPRIFEMFTQLDTSLERSRDGLGIGLTLVKNLVEMHGGSVNAHSDGPGRGSEFVVKLPTLGEETRPVPRASDRPRSGSSRRVLIVDDNVDGAEALALLLRLSNHEAFVAHDGEAALDVAERERPDLMLLDIGLPGINGYEVCRRIRREPWGKEIVIAAVTGWGQEADRQRSDAAGFDAHLVKPVELETLSPLIDRPVRA